MLTKAVLPLITPQPFITESEVREENGTLLAGQNSIVLSDVEVKDGEQMIVIVGGVVQMDYTITKSGQTTSIVFSDTADVNLPYKVIIGVVLSRVEDTYKDDPQLGTVTNANGQISFTLNTNSGDVYYTEVTQNSTITINTGSGQRMALLILKNAGAYTITWPANLRWPNGSAPTLTTNGFDYIYLSKLNIADGNDEYLLCGMVTKNLAKVTA